MFHVTGCCSDEDRTRDRHSLFSLFKTKHDNPGYHCVLLHCLMEEYASCIHWIHSALCFARARDHLVSVPEGDTNVLAPKQSVYCGHQRHFTSLAQGARRHFWTLESYLLIRVVLL